ATEEHINTLQENQELSERLHREQINRTEMERRLSATRLSLLQSQVNPHFLFNTLNTIAGMAELEGADTTDSMIRSLSNIFRYNLRTTEQFVSLTQELNVIRDYMYLQQMRFGERLKYEQELQPDLDTDLISVPAFTLQPLVENSVGHGLSRMERGGVIRIRVSLLPGGAAQIVIADNGMGMTPERLREVREALEEARLQGEGPAPDASGEEEGHRKVGIGVGNIYRRIYSLYRTGSMTIESTEGEGTEITLVIPQGEERNVQDSDRGR
ncbi:MAG: histidine kinase, partial [Stomatobaculum sp.]|nr:histidine kinase [Stomatobaculum sp.]